jgi:hypothetical protein
MNAMTAATKRRVTVVMSVLFLFAFSVLVAQDYLVWWDWAGDVDQQANLTQVEYAIGAIGADLNTESDAPISTYSVDLSTDWVVLLRDAGISEEVITGLLAHFRSDIIDNWARSLQPGDYSFWARTVNASGLHSQWTLSVDLLSVPQLVVPPLPPLNLRCAPCGS